MAAILLRFSLVLDKMATILFRFLMVLVKMAAILFKTEHHWKTECHCKTKQRAIIGNPNAFGIPAPTVLYQLTSYTQNHKCAYLCTRYKELHISSVIYKKGFHFVYIKHFCCTTFCELCIETLNLIYLGVKKVVHPDVVHCCYAILFRCKPDCFKSNLKLKI